MNSTKTAQTLYWAKGPPELQIRNIFKQHFLFSHLMPTTILHEWFEALNKKNNLSYWTTGPNTSKENVRHDAFNPNWTKCIAQLNNMATRAKTEIS